MLSGISVEEVVRMLVNQEGMRGFVDTEER